MQKVIVKCEKLSDWVGVVYLSAIGYHWKIYRKTNGKREQVAQSYYYTKDKAKAVNNMIKNYDIITGFQKDLFSI